MRITTIIFVALLFAASLCSAFRLPDGASVWPTQGRSVALSWDPDVLITPDDLFNITLVGFEQFRLVMVFMQDVEVENNFVKYDVSGRLGYIQAQAGHFPAGSEVRVYAVGIPSFGELHTVEGSGFDWAISESTYLFGEQHEEFAEASKSRAHALRSVGVNKRTGSTSVWVYGEPITIRTGQMINVFWSGFSPDAYIEVQLVCPVGKQVIGCTPAYQEYAAFIVAQFPVYPQTGCYVSAAAGTVDPESYICTVNEGTRVRSVRNYVLRAN